MKQSCIIYILYKSLTGNCFVVHNVSTTPVVFVRCNGMLVAWHTTWEACVKSGLTKRRGCPRMDLSQARDSLTQASQVVWFSTSIPLHLTKTTGVVETLWTTKQFPVSDLYKIYTIYNWMNNIHKESCIILGNLTLKNMKY